jgi:hypothetical protein
MAGASDQNTKSVKWPVVSQGFSSSENKLRAQRTAAEFAEKSYGGCGRAISCP